MCSLYRGLNLGPSNPEADYIPTCHRPSSKKYKIHTEQDLEVKLILFIKEHLLNF